jgi:hypothetical protein
MSRKWLTTLAFLGGLMVGAVAAWAFVGGHCKRNFSHFYLVQLADHANVATEILSGRGSELAERIKTGLPEHVRTVRTEFDDAAGAEWVLWMVSDVYEAAGTPPPEELRAVFAALPPRPSCQPPSI